MVILSLIPSKISNFSLLRKYFASIDARFKPKRVLSGQKTRKKDENQAYSVSDRHDGPAFLRKRTLPQGVRPR